MLKLSEQLQWKMDMEIYELFTDYTDKIYDYITMTAKRISREVLGIHKDERKSGGLVKQNRQYWTNSSLTFVEY